LVDDIINLLRELIFFAPDCYMGRIDDAERSLIEIRRTYGRIEHRSEEKTVHTPDL